MPKVLRFLLFAGVGAALFWFGRDFVGTPGKTYTVSSATFGLGQAVVYQKYEGTDLYQVRFAFKRENEKWKIFYVAHDEPRWRGVALGVDTNRNITVTKRGKVVARYNTETESLTLVNSGRVDGQPLTEAWDLSFL